MTTVELLKPEIHVTESSSTYSVLSLEPLERGYGMTLGNALRRVLLSSIGGAAITAVRIGGVLHEFSTVPGVREDVIEILMNLKKVSVLSRSSEVKILNIEMDGPCDVTAKHIQPDSEVDFVDPEAPICTLEAGAHLDMSVYVEQGFGYLSSERARPAWLPVDALVADAIFSPVLRVNYEVEAARVGQRTDYERLVLNVWTNGIIQPEMAVCDAAKVLEMNFKHVIIDLNKIVGIEDTSFGDEPRKPENELNKAVRELGLSIRGENCLMRGGIHTVGELLNRTRDDLLKIRNLGRVSLIEIEEKLAENGLHLKVKDEDKQGLGDD